MLVTWHRNLAEQFQGITGDWPTAAVQFAAHLAKARPVVKWSRTDDLGVRRVRLELLAATMKQHDAFFNAVFGLDPDAMIRTSRATYEGASDYLSQLAARVP